MAAETGPIGSELYSWLMIEDAAQMTTTPKAVKDMGCNISTLYLGIGKVGFNEAVAMTKTSTEINSTVAKVAFISVSQAVDLDTIETNSNASKVKTDLLTVTQAVDLDAGELLWNSALQAANIDDTAYGVSWNTDITHTATKNKLYAKFELVATAISTAQAAAQSYADGLVVGLLDDRGNYNASVNTFPASGGSGTAGAVLKGDLWTISVAGTLGGTAVTAGDVVRALVDTPGQTAGNWAVTENNFGYVAENSTNKSTSVLTDQASNIKYSSTKSIYDWGVAAFQPLDTDLTALASLTATTGNMILSVGSAWASSTPSTVRTALGLVIGTDVQASNANLTTLTTSTIGDLFYASGTNTIAKRAAGTNGYVLTMVGGVPDWAAAGGGGGATAFNDIGDAAATGAIDNLAYTQTLAWSTITTGNAWTISGAALTTGNLVTLTADAITTGNILNISSTSTVVAASSAGVLVNFSGTIGAANANYGIDVLNARVFGTTSKSHAIRGSVVGTNSFASSAVVATGHLGGTVYLGNKSSTEGVIWLGSSSLVTANNNFHLIGDAASVSLNAPSTTLSLQVSSTTKVKVQSTGVSIGSADPVSQFCVLTAPSGNANIGMLSIGSGGFAAGTFGTIGSANGTVLAINAATGYTGDIFHSAINSVSKFKIDSNGLLYTASVADLFRSTAAMTDYAAASAGTLTNAPAVGNPTKWIRINDNGTARYIPCW